MPEYRQIAAAGNQAGSNALRAVFETADHSDIPQLTAWDNENMNSTLIECLAGTAANGNKSMLAAKSTSDGHGAAGAAWATGLAQTAGGAEANRLKGSTAFVLLGTTPPVSPFPVHRTFQFAQAACADSQVGSIGYQPAVAVKVFYTGAPPTVNFDYNQGTNGAPSWVRMTSSPKTTAMPLGVNNTVHATGPDTTGGVGTNDGILDPVTKPGSGEKWAEEYWVRSL